MPFPEPIDIDILIYHYPHRFSLEPDGQWNNVRVTVKKTRYSGYYNYRILEVSGLDVFLKMLSKVELHRGDGFLLRRLVMKKLLEHLKCDMDHVRCWYRITGGSGRLMKQLRAGR